jgi:C4-dicarboxylate transporter DctM subunit
MGRVALPEMKRYNYDDSLATGCVAAAGSLGIMLAGLFIAVVVILCKRNPSLAPGGAPTTFKQKLSGLAGIIEMLVLFALVIGELFLGWFSPTQAGAAGAGGALIIGLARRQLTWQGFLFAVKDTLRITCMVMIIVTGAIIFGHFMAVAKLPLVLSEWVGGAASWTPWP